MKLHSHNPKTVENLIGGNGIMEMLNRLMSKFSPAHSMPETPFHDLENGDFDKSDPVAEKFLSMGGPKHVVKIFRIDAPEEMKDAIRSERKRAGLPTENMKKGGKITAANYDKEYGKIYRKAVKKMSSGGSVGSASKRADGIAVKGKTRGKIC